MYNNAMRKYILPVVSLIWLLFVLVLYYSGHKPAEPGQLLALLVAIWRMLAAGLLILLAGGLGASLWRGEGFHALIRLAIQAGLGLGLLGLGVLIVGLSVGLPAWLPWAALAVLLGLLWKSMAAWLKNWRGLADVWAESSRFGRTLGVFIGLIFLSGLFVALAPPIHYDSLTYHFALPNTYLLEGRIRYLPGFITSGMPQTAEMLYTWAIALGGNECAAVLGWGFGLLSILGLMGSLRQVLDLRAAWVGAAALLAGYSPAWLLSSGYVDWLVFLLGLGALVLLADWRGSADRRSLVVCGVLVGLAVGTKYTSAVLAFAAAAALAWHIWRRRANFLSAELTLALAAMAAAVPWFVKNWLTTNNPLYPFFMTSGAMSDIRLEVYQKVPAWGSWLDVVFLPLRATYLGFDAGEGYMFAPGMLLLGLGGLAWLMALKNISGPAIISEPAEASRPNQSALLSSAGLVAGAAWVIWALANQFSGNLIQTRYYYSLFPAFAVLAAFGDAGLRRIQLGSVRMGRIAAAVILIAVFFNTLESGLAGLRGGALETVLGLKSGEAYLSGNLGWFEPAMKAVRELPEGSLTQLIYDPRSLYCAPRCVPDELLDRWKRVLFGHAEDALAIRQAFRQEGISYLLVNQAGKNFLLDNDDPHHPHSDMQALDRFLKTLAVPVDFGGVYQLYSLE